MASENELAIWTLINQEKIDFKVKVLNWPQLWGIDIHDCEVTIQSEGRFFSGRGTDKDKSIAINKATAEAIERSVLTHNHIDTSNGVAAHLSISEAKTAACSELIERDLFLSHYLTKKPYYEIPLPTVLKKEYDLFFTEISRNLLKTKSYFLGEINGVGVYATALFGINFKVPFGIEIGLGSSTDRTKSLEKSLIECFRQASNIIFHPTTINNITIDDFSKIDSPTFLDHGNLALNLDFYNSIAEYFNTEPNALIPPKNFKVDTIQYSILETGFSDLKSAPLKFAQAKCKDLQSLYLGIPKPNDINLGRLRLFSNNKNLNFIDLNLFPHPLR
ncbi:YcaO-like family protein [Bdellovibrio reynosensis]|uniref:YcaO-like family protein n=1 Tax=Bdellovibrio reynosensis TaxID=2835041 RepID=A0ABY4C9R5_9BACT|nr:YcaO-like family protein [Bdellovibrio reynosensis]UOF00421.1 YcaO-like family protein [Bdellovibrio reynosensis]